MTDARHPNPTSGSETRRRCHQVGVRLLPEEWAKLTAHAEEAGEFPGTVLRRAYFPETPAEPTERDVEALAEVLAEHEWSPGYMHPEETCTCGWASDKYGESPCEAESVEAVSDDHRHHVATRLAERIAEARREGAAEVVGRAVWAVQRVINHWSSVPPDVLAERAHELADLEACRDRIAALRGDAFPPPSGPDYAPTGGPVSPFGPFPKAGR